MAKDIVEFPCGCEAWVENATFFIKPCSLQCKYYLYTLDQSKKQGNIIIKKEI